MHGKEFVIDYIRTFFSVVTLVNVVILILGLQIARDSRFGYDAFAAPLIYGAAGTVPNIVMYSKRELTVKELLVRKVIQFVLIEVIVMLVAFYDVDTFWKQPEIIIAVGISVFVIYVIASVIDWIQNYISAKQMTEELMKFQESMMD